MYIDLEKCSKRPLELRSEFDLSGRFAGYPEIETIDPVTADFRIEPVGGDRFLVGGGFAAHLTAYCVRCLEPFPLDVGARFQLTYMPESARPGGDHGEHLMDASQVDVSYYADDRLDLLPLLEEQINLALPMRFLCREGCRGLCPCCGANKNLTDCGCVEPRFDPRLETPKGLRN